MKLRSSLLLALFFCMTGRLFAAPAPGTDAARALEQLKSVAESPRYYWAWTHTLLDPWKKDGDARFAVVKDGGYAPKPTADVQLAFGYSKYLHRVLSAEGVKCAFVDTWGGCYGTIPDTPASAQDELAFSRRPEVIMEGTGPGFRKENPAGTSEKKWCARQENMR